MNDSNLLPDKSPPAVTVDVSGHGVHHLGYRGWSGARTAGWARSVVIAQACIRRSWQNRWLRRFLFCAWLPAVWFGVGFFLWEQAVLYPEWRLLITPLIRELPPDPVFDQFKAALQQDKLADCRHMVWAWLLNAFIRYPQSVLMVLVVGSIAPPLISQDIRSRAFLLYFSRPLTRVEYLVGKLATLWVYLGLITTVPALAMYLIGVLLSPSLNVILSTWDIPLRILAASVVLLLPTSALALCFSSLTQESRNAAFAWFAIWILGWFSYIAITTSTAFEAQRMGTSQFMAVPESVWTNLSLYHTLGRVQSWVFGFSTIEEARVPIGILIVVTVVSLSVMFRRISAPMRV